MRKNNATYMTQASRTRNAGVCATNGTPLVNQVLRGFQYTMPGVEDTIGADADLQLIRNAFTDVGRAFHDFKRLMLQFSTHHGSDEEHTDMLLHLMGQADLLHKAIDPDFAAYANAENELEQQRQAQEADDATKQVTEYFEDAAWLEAEKNERLRKALHQRYEDKMLQGREQGDYRP